LNGRNEKENTMNRRDFMRSGFTAGAAGALVNGTIAAQETSSNAAQFRLKYAPHFGMFEHHAGKDEIDQIRFMADQGFTALEDNGMMSRGIGLQNRIAEEMAKRDMTMGVFVATADFKGVTFASADKAVREEIQKRMKYAVECAKRVNAQWTTVVPGCYDKGLEWDYQTANVIENLKYCAEICEPSGRIMVLEPLNWYANHPGLFLTKIPQAFMICRAVNSPSCKILNDLYHQQVTEGNLIPNLDHAWREIAYFQVGDNPGRKEPTTGEINYRNIFAHLHAKGYKGIVGMEHGNSKPGKEGEQAVIDAYRYCDSF
jgi:hydroxypyruvate isomerase